MFDRWQLTCINFANTRQQCGCPLERGTYFVKDFQYNIPTSDMFNIFLTVSRIFNSRLVTVSFECIIDAPYI